MNSTSQAQGRHVMISGGSRGLGKAIVIGLLEAGYRVSTFSRTATEFTEQQSGNDRFYFAIADLADNASLASFVQTSEKRFGIPYGLINCAAIAADGMLATMPVETITKLVSVNVAGTLIFTRLVARRLLLAQTGGVILNISTVSALRGFKGLAAYAYTKGGIDSFTRALAREFGELNIRVNSIAPGYYDTEMSRDLSAEHREQILRRTPLGRLGRPEDVVGPTLFLLSEQASFVNGQTLVVDGGASV